MTLLKEFRPTILFLVKFVGFYLVSNFLYGMYITSYQPRPDPVTSAVTVQASVLLSWMGWDNQVRDLGTKPTTSIEYEGRGIISVYEGCNGVNVAVIFLSFIIAFGPVRKEMAWFIPTGLLILHVTNLARLVLLFFVSVQLPQYFFLTHKYLFTASIYLAVFVLWMWWVRSYTKRHVG